MCNCCSCSIQICEHLQMTLLLPRLSTNSHIHTPCCRRLRVREFDAILLMFFLLFLIHRGFSHRIERRSCIYTRNIEEKLNSQLFSSLDMKLNFFYEVFLSLLHISSFKKTYTHLRRRQTWKFHKNHHRDEFSFPQLVYFCDFPWSI